MAPRIGHYRVLRTPNGQEVLVHSRSRLDMAIASWAARSRFGKAASLVLQPRVSQVARKGTLTPRAIEVAISRHQNKLSNLTLGQRLSSAALTTCKWVVTTGMGAVGVGALLAAGPVMATTGAFIALYGAAYSREMLNRAAEVARGEQPLGYLGLFDLDEPANPTIEERLQGAEATERAAPQVADAPAEAVPSPGRAKATARDMDRGLERQRDLEAASEMDAVPAATSSTVPSGTLDRAGAIRELLNERPDLCDRLGIRRDPNFKKEFDVEKLVTRCIQNRKDLDPDIESALDEEISFRIEAKQYLAATAA